MSKYLVIVLLFVSFTLNAQDSIRQRLDLLNFRVSQMFYSGDRVDDSIFDMNVAEAKGIAKSLSDQKALSVLLRMEGLFAANVRNDIRTGLSKIDSSFSISFQISDSIGISKGHSAKANLFLHQNKLEEALTHYLQSLEYTDLRDDMDLFEGYYALAYCYDRMDDFSEAEYFYNKVLGLNISDPKYLPKSIYYKMMADAYFYVDRYPDAEFFLDKFLKIPAIQHSSYDLMQVHFKKGGVENAKEADDLAKSHYLSAIKYGNKIGDTILYPESLFNLGLTCSLMGDKDSAMTCLNESIKIFERTNRKHDLFDAYSTLGDIYYNYETHGRAHENYRIASFISYELMDTNKILKGLSNLADVQFSLKMYKTSTSNSLKVLKFNNESIEGIGTLSVRSYMNIGDCNFENKKLNTAYEYYEKAIKEADRFNLEARKALAFYNMAWVRMEQKKNIEAGVLINKGFKVADKHSLNGTKKQLCEASNYLKYQLKYKGSLPSICEVY
ncbi:MAG: tetratricopeptide (TPR) repeat protein [Saprospiraceae bacterium]|jgi:tetratricopeptide (TPR) repeat protein